MASSKQGELARTFSYNVTTNIGRSFKRYARNESECWRLERPCQPGEHVVAVRLRGEKRT